MLLTRLATKAFWNLYTVGHIRAEKRIPFAPIERTIELQNRRVRSIVSYAYAKVPYYRDVMDAAGVRPGDFQTANDLAKLPLLSGPDLAHTPDRFVSTNFNPARGLALQSSGTSGLARTVHWNAAALFQALATGRRHRSVLAHFVGRLSGYREVIVRRPTATTDKVRSFYEQNSWVPGIVDLTRLTLHAGQPFKELMERINEFRPDVVMGYGSHVGALYRWAIRNRIELYKPKVLFFGADGMAGADRASIEDELGIPVIALYEAVEFLRIGFQCELRQGYHISLDQVALRVVDDAGQTLPDGCSGHVTLSNLTNRGTVLLNYRLGDMATMSTTPCPCGRSLPIIERLDGRSDDFVVLPSGEIIHSQVLIPDLRSVGGTEQLHVEQVELRTFVVQAVAATEADRATVADGLKAKLRSLSGEEIDVTVEWCDVIPPEPNGKVRAVVSRVPRLDQ